MAYVDGFVLAVPKKNMAAYRTMARRAGKVWREYGALEFRECVGEDLASPMGVSFNKLAKVQPGETVVFSWIVYRSKADRERIIKKVMKDPRLADDMTDMKKMPFNPKRMAHGGFTMIVDA